MEEKRPFSAEVNNKKTMKKQGSQKEEDFYNLQDQQIPRLNSAKGFLIHKNNGTNQKPAKPTTQQDNFMRAQTAQTLPKPINSSQVYQQNNLKKMQDAQIQIESDHFKRNVNVFDKERLFEDLIHAKQIINELKDENGQLKTKLLTQQKDFSKLEKILEEYKYSGQFNNLNIKFSTDSFMYQSLKKQIKDQQQEVKYKTLEIDKLKKNIKFTKFQEIETEKKAFADETIRLRRLAEQMIEENKNLTNQETKLKQYEERCFLLSNLTETLRKDNTEMAQILKQRENKLMQQDNQIKQQDKVNKDQASQIQKLRKQLKEKEAELKNRPVAAMLKSDNAQQYKQINQEIEKRDKKIQELQKNVNLKKKEDRKKLEHKQQQRNQNLPTNMIPLVELGQIETYMQIIKCQLIKQQIPYNQLIQTLISQEMENKSRATYNQVKIQLEKEPFKITDNEKRHLVARYLTEGDIKDQYLIFDPDRFSPLSLIKLRFQDLIPEYNLNPDEISQSKYEQFKQWLISKESRLNEQFQQNLQSKSSFIDYSLIEQFIAKEQFIEFSVVSDLFILDLLKIATDLSKIPTQDFFLTFNIKIKEQANPKGNEPSSEQKGEVKDQTNDKLFEQLQQPIQSQDQQLYEEDPDFEQQSSKEAKQQEQQQQQQELEKQKQPEKQEKKEQQQQQTGIKEDQNQVQGIKTKDAQQKQYDGNHKNDGDDEDKNNNNNEKQVNQSDEYKQEFEADEGIVVDKESEKDQFEEYAQKLENEFQVQQSQKQSNTSEKKIIKRPDDKSKLKNKQAQRKTAESNKKNEETKKTKVEQTVKQSKKVEQLGGDNNAEEQRNFKKKPANQAQKESDMQQDYGDDFEDDDDSKNKIKNQDTKQKVVKPANQDMEVFDLL